MKEITREGFEYELTLSFEIVNDKHLAKASKDRTNLFMGSPEAVISEETGKELKEWSNNGEDPIDNIKNSLEELTEITEITELWESDNVKKVPQKRNCKEAIQRKIK